MPARIPPNRASFKGTVSRDFRLVLDFSTGFFHESVSLKPLSIPLGSFQIFSKIRGDIRCSTSLAKLVAKFAAGVADNGGKFAAGVVDTGGAPLLTNISANFRKN
jgi:hypothetical protein